VPDVSEGHLGLLPSLRDAGWCGGLMKYKLELEEYKRSEESVTWRTGFDIIGL
jgi:hypothetical protein